MKGTDLMDQITKPYGFDRKDPQKYYTKPFYDYLDMAIVNAFIVQEKLAAEREEANQDDSTIDVGESRPSRLQAKAGEVADRVLHVSLSCHQHSQESINISCYVSRSDRCWLSWAMSVVLYDRESRQEIIVQMSDV